MVEPISITASIIAIAGLAYSSCRALNNTINNIRDAPNTLRELRGDLDTVQSLLRSLRDTLEDLDESNLSAGQRKCFEDLEPYIRRCQATYDGFTKMLTRLTSHSDEERVSWRDRRRLHLERREIAGLKNGLQKDKDTLDIAINTATFRSTQQNQDALRSLERRILASMSEFTGEIQGLQMAVQSFGSSSDAPGVTKTDVDEVVNLLNRQIELIQQSLRVCDSGLSETSRSTGTTVETAKVLDRARQLIGNIGDVNRAGPPMPSVNVGYVEAKDDAYQGVGNISDEALKVFLGK